VPPSCGNINAVALNPSNSITPSDIPYDYKVYKVGANTNELIQCSDYYNPHMRKFRGQLWLLSGQNRDIPTGQEPQYYLSPTSIPALNAAGYTHWNVPMVPGHMRHRISAANGYLQMTTAGDAEVSFKVPFEVNKGVHAIRW